MNLKQILEITAREAPQKPAIILGSEKISYRELDERSNRIANALTSSGLKKGENVAILISHHPEWVSHYFGIIKAGGVAVLLSSALKAPELDSLLRDSETSVLITEKRFSRMLASVLPALPGLRRVLEIDTSSYQAVISSGPALSPDVAINPDDVATIIYTSGILGRQKGVVHTHASLLGTPEIVSAGIGRTREDVVVDPVPFFYLLGLSELLFGSIIKGASVVSAPFYPPGCSGDY
jgi:acyl-CoA synthetase (AMP-forming)/AMP-acid ligase II